MHRISTRQLYAFFLALLLSQFAQAQSSTGDVFRNAVGELTTSVSQATVIRVAVLPLEGTDADSRSLSGWITEQLVVAIAREKLFRMIERTDVNRLLDEQKFGAAGLVDPSTRARAQRLLGAEALLLGTIRPGPQGWTVGLRLVDTSRGDIISSAALTVIESDETWRLLGRTKPARPAKPPLAVLDFSELTVSLIGIRKLDARRIEFVLSYTSKSGEDFEISNPGNEPCGTGAQMQTSPAGEWTCKSGVGQFSRGQGVSLPSGGKSVGVFVFETTSPIEVTSASLEVPHALLKRRGFYAEPVRRYSVTFADVGMSAPKLP